MSILSPIQTLLVPSILIQETYDQPFFKKPTLPSENLLLQQQLTEWVHQIYFDQKKLNELSVLRLIEQPLEAIKPNIKCSIMYSIIRQKVQQVCKSIRGLIIDSYRKLQTKKQTNSDLKHISDSWNVNFSKFRKASIQTSMNKVYGPIAHIICTYHNSLLDCNTEVYNLWKLLYQCSEMKDLEFKTLQGSLNELILEQLMQEYPGNEMTPKDIMPTLSSFEKHEFIFKEMWGFQKRKLAVQFHAKNQDSQPEKERSNSLMGGQNFPKRIEKGQILSPPKPIPLSLKQIGVNTSKSQTKLETKIYAEKQLAKKKAMEDEIQFMQLQMQFSDPDSETTMKILQHLYDFRRQPTNNKEKQQTLKTIEKIIMNNLADNEKNAIVDDDDLDTPIDEPIEGELEDEEESQSDDGNNQYQYEDDNQIDQQNQNDDLLIRMKLKKMKEIQAFENFSREWRSKRLEDTREQQQRAKQTGERYLKLCERLDRIRKTYKAAGIQFKDPEIENVLNQSTMQAKRISQEIQQIEQSLPQLIPIKKLEGKQEHNIEKIEPKLEEKSSIKQKFHDFSQVNQPEEAQVKPKIREKPLKIQSSAYSLKLDEETEALKKESLYQKLKRYYETKTYEDFYCDHDELRQEKRTRTNTGKKFPQSQIFFGKNVPMNAIADLMSDKGKSITHAFSSNTKLSSKLQKISRQQILDQIYEVAKEKQKREKKGHNIRKDIKLTYKKISYEMRSGDQKNQIKITKGQLTSDDFNWFDDLPQKAKYHLGDHSDYAEKLIDEPNEDLCHDEKPEKKKKKKKKKKNKQKKQLSEDNENNFDKGSNSSLNDDEEDLQPLQQFKKRSISDLFNLRKMMGWPEGQSLNDYLESSQQLEREKEQEFLMEKKIEIYEKNGQKDKSNQRDRKAMSKENKNRRENYNEEELKLLQFLDNLEIKEENRDKCVVSEDTLQRIIMKRKQIKSMEIFEKARQRTEEVKHSLSKNEKERISEGVSEEAPKIPKPKNKKKKK